MKTCLVVDDSRVIRLVARRILEDLGYEVAEAENGEQAVAHCRNAMPAAVLMDWNMPVMSGLEAVKALRAMPGGDRPVVVFCTTENDPAQIARAMEAGADEYIMKPFDGEIVRSKFLSAGLVP
jgi:two-component system chemotaxis response regulator CheY